MLAHPFATIYELLAEITEMSYRAPERCQTKLQKRREYLEG
jgi:hypothetical protein